MRSVWIFIVTAVAFAITAIGFISGENIVTIVGATMTLLAFIWLWRSVVRPAEVARRGMELLGAQEYNNRLVKTGEANADKVVDLFNSLIARLSDESARVREQNCFLDLLIEVTPIGVAVMDYDGRIQLANKEFVSLSAEQNQEEIIGHRLSELSGELMRTTASLKRGERKTLRIGDNNIYRCSSLGFMERGFRKPFVIIERLTEEVRRAETESYGKVIRTIAHEVNNSVGSVSSFMETISADTHISSDYKDVADSCLERMDSLKRFIAAYADLARLPAPDMRKLDINDILTTMRPFLIRLLPENVCLEYDLCAGPLFVRADEIQIQQIIVNVVKNAGESLKTKGGEGMVKIKTAGGVKPYLKIFDNGVGIDPQTSDKIFTPFFTTKRGGHGIGLTLAAEVLSAHGWQFSLRTDSETSLTCFTINMSRID